MGNEMEEAVLDKIDGGADFIAGQANGPATVISSTYSHIDVDRR